MGYGSKFRVGGGGVYKCACCGRKTRDTMGNDLEFCGQCDELLMLQNAHWDGCYTPDQDPPLDKRRDQWIKTIEKRGGDVEAVKRQCKAIFPAKAA